MANVSLRIYSNIHFIWPLISPVICKIFCGACSARIPNNMDSLNIPECIHSLHFGNRILKSIVAVCKALYLFKLQGPQKCKSANVHGSVCVYMTLSCPFQT